jgi:hypothetical protein
MTRPPLLRRFKLCSIVAFAVFASGGLARADVKAAATRADLTREFTVVPAGDLLYTYLGALRSISLNSADEATGTSAVPDKTATMTRYEMALEVAKALITLRARQQADSHWASTLPPASLRSLRALCLALQSELARFNVDSKTTIALLDSWLQSPTATDTPANRPVLSTDMSLDHTTPRAVPATRETVLKLPLSQRLRVYGAVTSLARSSRDPLQPNEIDSSSSTLRLSQTSSQNFGSLGGALALTDRIQLRGEVAHRPIARTLREAFDRNANVAGADGEHSIGGGVDFALWPGVTLSGDVAHLQTSGGLLAGLSQFSGTKYEGGVGLSGWQNRVALSANLSRLVPEDSLAFSMTAAQLNLDVGVTQQLSLKLLYQQLFETPQQPRGERMIAGGININF